MRARGAGQRLHDLLEFEQVAVGREAYEVSVKRTHTHRGLIWQRDAKIRSSEESRAAGVTARTVLGVDQARGWLISRGKRSFGQSDATRGMGPATRDCPAHELRDDRADQRGSARRPRRRRRVRARSSRAGAGGGGRGRRAERKTAGVRGIGAKRAQGCRIGRRG